MHLGKIEKRKALLHLLVDQAQVDICVVAETRFIKGRGCDLMEEVFKEEFVWYGKDRVTNIKGGIGGVGILIRKGVGITREVKRSKTSDVIWVEIKMGEEVLLVAGVYWSPGEDLVESIQELEEDIGRFKEQGKVVVMGDFNCRIGELPTVYSVGSRVVFPRKSEDVKVNEKEKTTIRRKGRMFIDSMNASDMFVMNGLDSGSEYTFFGNGNSIIDYIVLSRELLIFDYTEEEEGEEMDLYEKNANQVITNFKEPNSGIYYRPRSTKVWNEFGEVVSDHRLVTCELSYDRAYVMEEKQQKVMPEQSSWNRKDNGDPAYWEPLRQEMEKQFGEWDMAELKGNSPDELSNSFLEILNDIANKTLGRRSHAPKDRTHKRKVIKFDQKLYYLLLKEKETYLEWKCGNKVEKENLKRIYKMTSKERRKRTRELERQLEDNIIDDMERLRCRNPKEYWRKLYELAGKKQNTELPTQIRDWSDKLVSGNEALEMWKKSFEKLGTEEQSEEFNADFYEYVQQEVQEIQEEMKGDAAWYNRPLELEEISRAIKTLRRGKAAGLDGMINEIFMYGGPSLEAAVHKLFNKFWDMEEFPSEWSKGLICPIFKGGTLEDKLDPTKYRGITLLSIVGKLFSCVLKNRLEEFCEANNVLAEEQAGFRSTRSTIDHIFTLHEIIMNRRPKRTYCCFIDIQKAYDRVWRDGLWKKLYDAGIRGKLWNMIKNMYTNVQSCMGINGVKSNFFQIKLGLRQGCVLSPLLFDIFINDLVEEIKKSELGVQYGNDKIAILLFADDIVIIAETAKDLQLLMNILYEYSLKWRIKFNHEKSAVVVFQHRNTERGKNKRNTREWWLGTQLILETDSYKYLGVEMDKGLTFIEFKTRIADKARKNRTLAWNMGIKRARLSVKAGVNLWHSLIRPSLEYGSQIWGLGRWEEAEVIQREMGRKILRCNRQSSSVAVRGELGWWTISGRRDYIKLRYWIHLLLLDNTRLIKRVYQFSKQTYERIAKNNWTKGIHQLTKKYNITHLWENEEAIYNVPDTVNTPEKIKRFWFHQMWMKVQIVEEKKWRKDLEKKSKLALYRSIKQNLEMEKYLTLRVKTHYRKIFTLFRMGTYPLQIEKGRWFCEEKQSRVCLKCMSGAIEDELHFLFECEVYEFHRQKFYAKVKCLLGCTDPENQPKEKNWETFMRGQNPTLFKEVTQYLAAALRTRNRI